MAFNLTEFSAELGSKGFARPSYFAVMITLPTALAGRFGVTGLPLRIESASFPSRGLLTADQRYYGPTRRIPYGYAVQDLSLNIILSEDMVEREIFSAWQDLVIGKSRTTRESTAIFDAGYYKTGVDGASVELMSYATSPLSQGKGNAPTIFTQTRKILSDVGIDTSKITNPRGFDLPKVLSKNKALSEVLNLGQDRNIDSVYTVKLIEPFPNNVADLPLNWSADGYSSMTVTMQYRYFTEDNLYSDDANFGQGPSFSGVLNGLGRFTKSFRPFLSTIQSKYVDVNSKFTSLASQSKDVLKNFRKRI